MKKIQLRLVQTVLLILSLFSSTYSDDWRNSVNNLSPDEIKNMNFSHLRDTIYTLHPYFIEVNLKTQIGYLHSKHDSVIVFGVSTGTRRVKDGINTKEGLFSIQYKNLRIPSVQFDSTMMLYWMGFNWGIGFHALYGNSYYKYLGEKPSSHGCVRISREDAKEIYSKIEIGTPVIVHSGNNVVQIAFADSSDENLKYYSFRELNQILPKRYNQFYNGKYFETYREKLLIDKYNVDHAGLPIGDNSRISKRQLITQYYYFIESVIPDPRSVHLLPGINSLNRINQNFSEYYSAE